MAIRIDQPELCATGVSIKPDSMLVVQGIRTLASEIQHGLDTTIVAMVSVLNHYFAIMAGSTIIAFTFSMENLTPKYFTSVYGPTGIGAPT